MFCSCTSGFKNQRCDELANPCDYFCQNEGMCTLTALNKPPVFRVENVEPPTVFGLKAKKTSSESCSSDFKFLLMMNYESVKTDASRRLQTVLHLLENNLTLCCLPLVR
uniref:EGF-like domain-containing protein n=1 Tax=Stegastes partitus TaxID=144197 RepID=A0A3B5AHL2_9TELE